ncbi:MAG TPA: hypothetical protein VGD58_21900 [Herpetosiphonaceae bacterium]
MNLYRRWTSKRLVGIAAVFVLLAACSQPQQAAQPAASGAPIALPLSGAVKEAPGKLLFDRTDAWWTYEPGTEQKQEVFGFPEQSFPSTPALSPDGTMVAFSVFSFGKGPDDPAYGTDLYLMKADGSDPQVFLAHEAAAETLTDPAWSHDGRMLYFTRRSPQGDYRIERIGLDKSDRQVIVESAQSPTLSADGQYLAYINFGDPSQSSQLVIANPEGGSARPLLKDLGFLSVGVPRFAPSGNQMVFAAVPENAPSPSAQAQRPGLFDWARPRAARAHGVPWDLWLINPDGSGLRQLTHLQEDYPIPSWSPDGAWIGFKGELGLYVVDLAEGKVRRVAEDTSASIAWLP